jgi:diguanylate cyclase (GGDEF)-like protein
MLGIGALVTGLLVDLFLVRLLCLFVVSVCAVLVSLSFTSGDGGEKRGDDDSQLIDSHFETDQMKKMIFDDFQPESGGRYVDDNVEEQFRDDSPADEPATPESFVPALKNFAAIKPETKQQAREFNLGDFFDLDSDFFKGGSEPRTEFNYLITKVLALIKESVFANTVAFFWANREKQQMVLEAKLTDSQYFMNARRFPIEHDLVSKVARTSKPELITDVNPVSERELIRYYDIPSQVKSFVGVPVFYSTPPDEASLKHPVGVIAIDSTAEGAFGEETLAMLGHFTKLASGLIKSYTDKYDLLRDSELVASQRRMLDRLRNEFSQPSVINVLADEASKLVSWDYLSIVLLDEASNTWRVKKTIHRGHDPYVTYDQAIDFPDSIAGHTIKNNIYYHAETLEGVEFPSFYKGEQLKRTGSMISLPISSPNKCYGAILIESGEAHNYSRHDIEMIQHLTAHAASVFEIVYLNEIITEYVIVDEVTGVYSKKFFLQRLREELQRADEQASELSLLMITVDHASDLQQRFTREGIDRVMTSLAKGVRGSVRAYDLVGRYDQHRFAVMLVNTAANEAYIWAEKIRKNVSANVITIEGKSFSITISVGVCGAMEGMRAEELIGNTVAVLQKAAETGGNAVRVY